MWQCGWCGYRVTGGVDDDHAAEHECDPRSVVRHQAARLDEAFAAFLDSPAGRFEQFCARRRLDAEQP